MTQSLLLWISVFFLTVLCASAQTNLEDVYQRLGFSDHEKPLQETLRAEFDLERCDVSVFLLNKMNKLHHRGLQGPSPVAVMSRLFRDRPGKSFEWVIDAFDQFSPAGLANMMGSLRHAHYRETYHLLTLLLTDKTVVVNKYAVAITPDLYYRDRRVCDYAYQNFVYMLQANGELPDGMPKALFTNSSIQERDEAIHRFSEWWTRQSANILKKKPSIGKNHPAVTTKLEKLKKK